MAVDTSLYVGDFDTAVPAGGDIRSEGDDNFRQVKTATKNSFPNITGAVTKTHTEINDLAEKSTAQTISGDWTHTGDITLVNPVDEFSTDGTLAGNSDTALPTEKAVKTYVDSRMVGMAQYSGDPSRGTTRTRTLYFPTEDSNSLPAGLATVDNTAADGLVMTAVSDCLVHFSLWTFNKANAQTVAVRNGTGTSLPPLGDRFARTEAFDTSGNYDTHLSGTALLDATDEFWFDCNTDPGSASQLVLVVEQVR